MPQIRCINTLNGLSRWQYVCLVYVSLLNYSCDTSSEWLFTFIHTISSSHPFRRRRRKQKVSRLFPPRDATINTRCTSDVFMNEIPYAQSDKRYRLGNGNMGCTGNEMSNADQRTISSRCGKKQSVWKSAKLHATTDDGDGIGMTVIILPLNNINSIFLMFSFKFIKQKLWQTFIIKKRRLHCRHLAKMHLQFYKT